MAGVFEDEEFSLEDAQIYTDALLQAEADHQTNKRRRTYALDSEANTRGRLENQTVARDDNNQEFTPIPLRVWHFSYSPAPLLLETSA